MDYILIAIILTRTHAGWCIGPVDMSNGPAAPAVIPLKHNV